MALSKERHLGLHVITRIEYMCHHLEQTLRMVQTTLGAQFWFATGA
jgi:hypothetical protein